MLALRMFCLFTIYFIVFPYLGKIIVLSYQYHECPCNVFILSVVIRFVINRWHFLDTGSLLGAIRIPAVILQGTLGNPPALASSISPFLFSSSSFLTLPFIFPSLSLSLFCPSLCPSLLPSVPPSRPPSPPLAFSPSLSYFSSSSPLVLFSSFFQIPLLSLPLRLFVNDVRGSVPGLLRGGEALCLKIGCEGRACVLI